MAEEAVLVVDDELDSLDLCRRVLEQAGFQVFTAISSTQALAILSHQEIGLLLTDLRVPDMDGFQLMTRALKQVPELAVVLMTGYGTIETAIEALQRGADGFVLKPFADAELVQSVKSALLESQHKRDILRLQTLRPLFDITRVLFAETDRKKLQNLVVDAICGSLLCSHAAFFERELPDSPLELVEERGNLFQDRENQLFQFVEGAELQNSAVWVSHSGGTFNGSQDLSGLLNRYQLQSIMCVPLAMKDGRGVLAAARHISRPAFHEADFEMLVILARQAAVAFEKAAMDAELRSNLQRLEESQRGLIMAEKIASAGRLTSTIAHEINNPLQSVTNCLELVERDDLAPQEKRFYLDLARSELDRLTTLVHRMLDLYRPGGRERRLIKMEDMIERVLVLVHQQMKEHQIHAQTRYAPDTPPVLAVGSQIEQVLMNLILNSIEAITDSGEILIETRVNPQDNMVEAVVKDSGPGIPPHLAELIFEPFMSTKENGTGLGLPVSYGIIEAHGGRLKMIPNGEQGACFLFALPIGDPS
jgi:signal transduction histidine kinase/DNA-binding response OmpR family regulator